MGACQYVLDDIGCQECERQVRVLQTSAGQDLAVFALYRLEWSFHGLSPSVGQYDRKALRAA